MEALVTQQGSDERRPPRRIEKLGRSVMVLYWSAGLLLVLPFALSFWAVSTLYQSIKGGEMPPPPPQ